MRTYIVKVSKNIEVVARIEVEAESAEQAAYAGSQHDWTGETFEPYSDWRAPHYISAESENDSEDVYGQDISEGWERGQLPKVTPRRVWTLTSDTDNGLESSVYFSEADFEKAQREFLESYWELEDDEPPEDNDDFLDEIRDRGLLDMDSVNWDYHDIPDAVPTPNPRVLVEVYGGCADFRSKGFVDVNILDHDAMEDEEGLDFEQRAAKAAEYKRWLETGDPVSDDEEEDEESDEPEEPGISNEDYHKGPANIGVAAHKMMIEGEEHEYLFDVRLLASIRVEAKSEAEARAMLSKVLDCADANFGAWPNGDPVTGECSIAGEASLVEGEFA